MRYKTKKKIKAFLALLFAVSLPVFVAFVTKRETNLDIRNFAGNKEVAIIDQYVNLDRFFITAQIKSSTTSYNNRFRLPFSFASEDLVNPALCNSDATVEADESKTKVQVPCGGTIILSLSLKDGEDPENVSLGFDQSAFKIVGTSALTTRVTYKLKALQMGSYTVKAVIFSQKGTHPKSFDLTNPIPIPQDAREVKWSVDVVNGEEQESFSRVCKVDSDCVIVNKPFTCCFNVNGEKQAVNVSSYNKVREKTCPNNLKCPESSSEGVVCQNNVCQLSTSPSSEKTIKAILFKPKLVSDNKKEKVEIEFCKATGGVVAKGKCVFKLLSPPNEKAYDLYKYKCSCLDGSDAFCNKDSLVPIISDCPANSLNKPVIKPVYSNADGTTVKASFNADNLLKNLTYEIEVSACTDSSCTKPFVNSVKSKRFVLTNPYLSGEVDSTDSCIFNNVKLKISKTNARWVNVIAYKENVLVSNNFQQLKSVDDYYTGEFAIPSTPNTNLNIKVYGCDSNDRKSCVTELKSFKLKTDTCEGVQQVDLEAVHASVDSSIEVGKPIPITIVLRNNSNQRFGPITIVMSYYEKNDVGHKYAKTISISAIRGGEIFSTTLYLDGVQKEGQYIGSVTAAIANSAYEDRNPGNNKTDFSFIAVPANFVCDKSCEPGLILTDDCRCVECVDDVNCNGLSVCDLSTNKCVPDYEACAPNKVPNEDLTACVCPEPCNAGQWQDNNCVCHDQKTCNKTCGEKEILAPDCVCEPVECVSDKDCSGLSKCNIATHTCQCSLTCPTGFIVDDACNRCVCASSCPEGYVQRSDCSCQVMAKESNSESEEDLSDVQKAGFTKLSIVSPINGQKFVIGEKIILSYRIVDGDEPNSVSWLIGGEEVSTKNNDTVILDKSGDLSVVLKVDGTVMDSVDIFVADEDTAKLQKLVSKATETKNDKNSTLIRYLAIGLSITVTLAVMTFLLVK